MFPFAQKTEKEGGGNPLFNFQDFPREEEIYKNVLRRSEERKTSNLPSLPKQLRNPIATLLVLVV